jgi:DNA-binding LacI/PurR family transcriptional regulator
VPGDISLVGFDGNPVGFEKGITSFDFDFPNIIRQMLFFIARPLAVTRFTRGNTIEMPGLILHRDSTGRAPHPNRDLS